MTLATRLFARPCLASVVLALSAGSAGGSVFKAACAPGPNADAGNGPALVGAIEHANSHAGPDTVLLERNCTYTLTAPDNYWYGPNGLPPIASNITVEGNGSTILRYGAAPHFRLFFVGADPANSATGNYVSPGPGKLTLRH